MSRKDEINILLQNICALFRNKMFMLDDMTGRNKIQSCFFHFSFRATYFIFSPNECPDLCRHRPGHSLGKKVKLHEMKNGKSNFRVFVYTKYDKF